MNPGTCYSKVEKDLQKYIRRKQLQTQAIRSITSPKSNVRK